MKLQTAFIRAAVLTSILVSIAAQAQQQPPELKMPSNEQVTIFRALRNLPCQQKGGNGCHDLRFTGGTIEFDVTSPVKKGDPRVEHFSVDLKSLQPVFADCKVKVRGFMNPVAYYLCHLAYKDGKASSPEVAALFNQLLPNPVVEPAHVDVPRFIPAQLAKLHEVAMHPESPLYDFPKAAAAWRALPQRPPVSDAVRVPRLMAEDAVKQGQPYMALYYYETGLEKDPFWADGYFNAALVAASVKVYKQAAQHMEHYLELIPDAPDAQTARDQIDIWKVKAQEK